MRGAGRLLDRRRLLERGIYQIIYGNCLPHRFLSPWLQFKIHSVRFSCFNSTVAYSTDCIVLYCTFPFTIVYFFYFHRAFVRDYRVCTLRRLVRFLEEKTRLLRWLLQYRIPATKEPYL